ncbi:MAG: ATP-binding cassette domain-containing protein [Thermoleophilia bacterium]|nr:ATP-binding cassette domain-containing protein [Thermoleophilia bacterium]
MSTAPGDGAPAPVVRVRDLEVRYQRGAQAAVSGVGFELAPGEGLLLTGGPGAGKTSVLRAVLGLVETPVPRVMVFDRRPGDEAAMRRVGYAPQRWPFTRGLRAGEVATLACRLKGLDDPAAAAADAMRRAALTDPTARVERLEIEDVRRLCLACAIAGTPDLLVLDDPWEFPETEREVRDALARGAAVLAASADPGGLPALLGRTLELADGAPVEAVSA